MTIKIDNYTFNRNARTVTFLDYTSILLSRVVLITNVNTNFMLYNFAGSGKGGTVSGNVLTLDYDTSSMADTDTLQILYDDGSAPLLTQLVDSVKKLFQVMANPPWVDKSANQLRAQVTGALTGVTTVGTVSTLTTFGTYPAHQIIIDQNRATWAAMVRGRIV